MTKILYPDINIFHHHREFSNSHSTVKLRCSHIIVVRIILNHSNSAFFHQIQKIHKSLGNHTT